MAVVLASLLVFGAAGCSVGAQQHPGSGSGSGQAPVEAPAVKLRPARPTDRGNPPPQPGEPAPPVSPTTAVGRPSIGAFPQPALGPIINGGPGTRREIALTFDADMSPQMVGMLRDGHVAHWYDSVIMNTLRTSNTPATVFMTGMWARQYPTLARTIAANPLYEIENHSYDHAAWTRSCYGLPSVLTTAGRINEVLGAAREIDRVTGVQVHYFRYPGGCHTPRDDKLVRRLGEQPLGWNVVSGDPFQPDPSVVEHNVLSRVADGSIVVMHFIGAPNAPATGRSLAVIIPELRKRGYTFVLLDQLLATDRA